MRVSPVFSRRTNLSNMKQTFQRAAGAPSLPDAKRAENSSDIFIRLAEASLRDSKIESELKQSGLI